MSNSTKSIIVATFAYTLVRFFSFVFLQGTAANTIIALGFTGVVAWLLIVRSPWAYKLIAAEFILGGMGVFFHLGSLSLRTVLFILAMAAYIWHNRKSITLKKPEEAAIVALVVTGIVAAAHGYVGHHDFKTIAALLTPYAYLLYFFPLKTALESDDFKNWCTYLLAAAIIGQLGFILFTFVGFATHYFTLQDSYYHWFRDVAGGKITSVAYNFYRVVLPEQLLLIPILGFYLSRIIKKQNLQSYLDIVLTISLLLLLAINITRGYLLGLIVLLAFLYTKQNIKRFTVVSIATLISFFALFSLTYFLASGGHSFGLEVFGLRLQSIIMPQIESSSLSRLLLLPPIETLIQNNFFFGVGLGATLTVYSPVVKEMITTSQFDWGYLQIIAEFGLAGFMVWAYFLSTIYTKIKRAHSWSLAGFAALLVINITSPALFHALGILYLATILAVANDASPQ